MKKTIFLLAIFISLVSCSKNNDGPTEPMPFDLKDGSEMVIESMNEFGLDIFNLILADEPAEKNVFISPASISLALAMTLNGANNATEDSMAFALRMDDLTSQQINETFRDLMNGLTTCDEKVLLEIANSIWYRQGYTVEQDFLDINEEYYNAEVAALDFSSPDALETINGWVADRTHDKIPEIINRIDPAHVMFLINAIYFKGIWSLEFDEESTYDGNFELANSTSKEVPMMHMEETIDYFDNELFQACELDYGRGNFGMVVLLPKPEKSLDDVIEQLNESNWNTWVDSFDTAKVNLSLPKFTFEYEKGLNDILGLMGMGIAFTGAADFTGINSGGGLYIDYVKHKTFVEVNEEGTEAAAATIVAIIETSAGPDETKYMTVNRPFLFVIREKTTNTIVFMGKVAEPVDE
jgi:serine protease inhibitor